MEWQPIATAPKDSEILVWFDHDADPYQEPDNPERLTDYGAHAESGEFLEGSGVTVAKWQDRIWESVDEYGDGYWVPAGWFSRGDFGHFEVVCNATHWTPIPGKPDY